MEHRPINIPPKMNFPLLSNFSSLKETHIMTIPQNKKRKEKNKVNVLPAKNKSFIFINKKMNFLVFILFIQVFKKKGK